MIQVVDKLLSKLYSSLIPFLGSSWCDQTKTQDTITQIQLCKIEAQTSVSTPLVITHTLLVERDLSWNVFVHGHHINRTTSGLLSSIPSHIDSSTLLTLLSILDSASVCPGHPDSKFIEIAKKRKGVFYGQNGEIKASLESSFPVVRNGVTYSSTIRASQCEILIKNEKSICETCKAYGSTLRAIYSRCARSQTDASTPSKFTNNRYLASPQKMKKMKELQERACAAEKEVKMLREAIECSVNQSGINVDSSFHQDLLAIMNERNSDIEKKFSKGTFRRLFWEQQLKSAQGGARQMRWHPTMIRCECLSVCS